MSYSWKHIILYVALALGIAYLIQHEVLASYFESILNETFLSKNSYLFSGLSTLIAALVAIKLHKGLSNRITVFGTDKVKNGIILCLPIIAFSFVGLDNGYGIHKSLYGFGFSLTNTIYSFVEEFGWRRYLQNALDGMRKTLKYLLIGVVWWIWHFRFESHFDIYIFPLICLGGGFLLGKLADTGKSILPVVAMHTLIILTTNSGKFGKNEILGIVFVLFGWVLLEKLWKIK